MEQPKEDQAGPEVAATAEDALDVDVAATTALRNDMDAKIATLEAMITELKKEVPRTVKSMQKLEKRDPDAAASTSADGQVVRVYDFSCHRPAPGRAGPNLRRHRGTGCPPTCGRCVQGPNQPRSGVGLEPSVLEAAQWTEIDHDLTELQKVKGFAQEMQGFAPDMQGFAQELQGFA